MTPVEYLVLYGLAFVVPLGVTLVTTPFAIAVAKRFGILDRPGERKVHLDATPYLGGAAIALGLIVAAVLTGSTARQAAVIGAGAVVVFVVGLLDDVRGLGPATRAGVEVLVGAGLWFGQIRAGLFGFAPLDLLLTIAWIVVVTNSVNLLDNMDGLASGVTAIAAIAYFVMAAAQENYFVASMAIGLAGASVGFLRHNFPPARIFLGDAGSLLLGYLLAVTALIVDLNVANPVARAAVQALILGVPVFDTAFVVITRIRAGRPVLVGGTDHSSHHLARRGLSPRRVALVLYGGQAICSAAAVAIAIGR
ncbi:MAG TPA: MraY family glycosyltransferase [Actinomycetota bacterium]|nr:MraY family glycosyltransferase [Actinomycetota bacterium]